MEPRRDELTHDEIWDDSALIDSWNQALEEYKVRHPSTRPNEACNSHISTEFDVLTPHPEIPQHPRKGRLGRRHSRPVGVSVVPVPFSLPHVGQSSGRNRSGELVDPHYRFRTPRRDAKPETADGRQPIEDEDNSVEEGEVDVGAQTDETSANGQGTDAQQVNHPKDGFLPPPMVAEHQRRSQKAWRRGGPLRRPERPDPDSFLRTPSGLLANPCPFFSLPESGWRWSEGSARCQRWAFKSRSPDATRIRFVNTPCAALFYIAEHHRDQHLQNEPAGGTRGG